MRRLAKTLHKVFSPSGKGLGEKGFTLIELLVVIGILAVLAGVVTLSVGQFIGRGGEEAACTDLHNVQTAAAAWLIDNPGGTPTQAVLVGTLLLTEPKCDYTFNANGSVATQDCGDDPSCPNLLVAPVVPP